MPELILGTVAVISTILFARELYIRKKSSSQASQESKTYQDLNELVAKSRDLLGQTEEERKKIEDEFDQKVTKVIESEQIVQNQLLDKTKEQLTTAEQTFDSFLDELKTKTASQQTLALEQFTKYLEELKQSSKTSEVANMKGASERVNQLFENFETKLADFLLQSEQKMMLAVDLELRSARQLIDTYKVQQMNVIDENIVAMLEKTLSLVLAKNLNLKDQMDLVYESLEKAKTEKFII